VAGRQREDEVIRVKELHLSPFLIVVLAGTALFANAGSGTSSTPSRRRNPSANIEQAGRFVLDTAFTRIWFEADASLGRFEGRATRFSGWADVADSLNFVGSTGRVEIEVASFKTGNGMRDGHLRGDMKADRFPLIVFENSDVQPAEIATIDSMLAGIIAFSDAVPAARVFIGGKLTIQDSTREVRIPARVRVSGDTMRVRGRLSTRFTEFGMKPPSRILGTVKVKDNIVLLFDALFRRGGS
jgi:polyisoprenoid-binding protein YceI